MMRNASRYVLGMLLASTVAFIGVPSDATSASRKNVFGAFTEHIQRQVEVDKRVFVDASACTQWFYKQQREKPQKPSVEGVSLRGDQRQLPINKSVNSIDCASRYPGGLDAAREDFSNAQSTLSLSLTFYEFALVGDRNDDQDYSHAELKDILESFGLAFNPALPSPFQLSTLSDHFDTVHDSMQFDLLMSGMGKLYEQGYRFTFRDKEALNRIMG